MRSWLFDFDIAHPFLLSSRTLCDDLGLQWSSTTLLLDATAGYHQIKLDVNDQIKTAFITPFGAYCYLTMPFGLKNGGATYQRTMLRCLQPQLGRNIHVYVDDLVVKLVQGSTLLADLEETFANLCTYKIKLNPEKCVFGVPDGKLLGFFVSERGIECNP